MSRARWIRKAVALVIFAAARRTYGMSADEARSVLAGRKITFFGDSISRYCYFGFNTFLATGALREDEFKGSGGYGEDSSDYDTREQWTDWCRFNDNGECKSHTTHFTKTLGDVETEYFFVQNVWFDEADTGGEESLADLAADFTGDVVVFNAGWWHLKEDGDFHCGKDWTTACEEDYRARLASVIDGLLDEASLAFFRSTSCCGEEDDDWIESIEAQNAVAKEVMAAAGITVVDVYDTFGWDDLDEVTFDDKHPDVEMCHTWNTMILEAVAEALNAAATYEPTYAPTAGPTRTPTPKPTLKPTPAPAPDPTTGKPTACMQSTTWFKTEQPSKDCSWVGELPDVRCSFKGDDGTRAYESCGESCGCSSLPSSTPTVSLAPSRAPVLSPSRDASCNDDAGWFKKDDPSKTCDWVSELVEMRCDAKGDDDSLAHVACRATCGTCSGNLPTTGPMAAPSPRPSLRPSASPSPRPSPRPSLLPLPLPSSLPTEAPSLLPTYVPTFAPTSEPTRSPTAVPTYLPTVLPTGRPSLPPTLQPTSSPSRPPTALPSRPPTLAPSEVPTSMPSPAPSLLPTVSLAPTRLEAIQGSLRLGGLNASAAQRHVETIVAAVADVAGVDPALVADVEVSDVADVATKAALRARRRRRRRLARRLAAAEDQVQVDYVMVASSTILDEAEAMLRLATKSTFDAAFAKAAVESGVAVALFAGVTTLDIEDPVRLEDGGKGRGAKGRGFGAPFGVSSFTVVAGLGLVTAVICLAFATWCHLRGRGKMAFSSEDLRDGRFPHRAAGSISPAYANRLSDLSNDELYPAETVELQEQELIGVFFGRQAEPPLERPQHSHVHTRQRPTATRDGHQRTTYAPPRPSSVYTPSSIYSDASYSDLTPPPPPPRRTDGAKLARTGQPGLSGRRAATTIDEGDL